MTTDALVSELRDLVHKSETHYTYVATPVWHLMCTKSADTIDRLTRERGEARRDNLTSRNLLNLSVWLRDEYKRRLEIAEAERDAARRELAATQSCNEGLLERLRKMEEALRKARVAIATWSPDPTEPLEEIDAALKTEV